MRRKPGAPPPATTVDEYFERVPEPAHSTLAKMRKTILSSLPADAIEVISYQIPSIRYKGMLLHYAAFQNHCSFFPGPQVIDLFKEELKAYETSKGTIRVPSAKPLPPALLKQMVKTAVSLKDAKSPKAAKPKNTNDHSIEPQIEAIRKLILNV